MAKCLSDCSSPVGEEDHYEEFLGTELNKIIKTALTACIGFSISWYIFAWLMQLKRNESLIFMMTVIIVVKKCHCCL